MKSLIRKIWNIITSVVLYLVALIYTKICGVDNSDIWLISERGNDARDNGWHFYNYLKTEHPEIKVKYVIAHDSQDVDRIEKEDRIEYRSFKHYILFLTAGKLISTHIMGFSPEFSLFWRLDKKGLVKTRGKRVFLQHGITQNFIPIMTANVSKLDTFVCGAKPEYDYILKNFGYPETVVKYTGFARFDKLINNPKKQILVMPTWRKYLKYEDNFTNTKYYKAWQSFLNNKQLSDFLIENNYELVFYPHYEMQKYLNDFSTGCKKIKIASIKDYDVQALLKESELLITDFSSVFFDFAYMNKPVFYYQFDYKEFRKGHYAEGFFDYERDGFGPVFKNENDLIDKIIKNAWMKTIKNVGNFFTLMDANNCERIFNEIKD